MISVKQNKEQEKTARSRRKCVQCETGQLEGWRKVREKKERKKRHATQGRLGEAKSECIQCEEGQI